MAKQTGKIQSSGRLRYFAAQNMVIAVQSPFARVKLLRLNFGGDGSIYVSFPYLEAKRGLVSNTTFTASPTLDLGTGGVVVETDIKFSHHVSGVSQFSKTAQLQRGPRRQSFRLDGPIGRLFMFNAYWLRGFTWLEPKKKDFVLVREFRDGHPFGLAVEAVWLRKKDIVANAVRVPGTVGDHVGPTTQTLHQPSNVVSEVIFIGQPSSSPLKEHVVMLSISQIAVPSGANVSTMLFFGGFDVDEAVAGQPQKFATGCLAFMYPFEGEASASLVSA